jgi:hypothetical protein
MTDKKIKYKVDYKHVDQICLKEKLSSGEIAMLYRLRDKLGGKNYCYYKQSTLAWEIGKDERTINRYIATLKAKGIITVRTKYIINPKTGKKVKRVYYYLDSILVRTII